MSAPYTFYEFFAGGGMARAGLGDRWTCLFANDFDRLKAETYRANWEGDDLCEKDVWALGLSDLAGTADLAWASSPCQDLSLAGKRAGLSGGRSSAFWGFWRLIKALGVEGRAPRTIVIENVVGLLTSHGGADFTMLCKVLAEEGYHFGAVEVDAARFLPQSRPRMFLVAAKQNILDALTQVEPTLPFHSKRVQLAARQLPKKLDNHWVWWKLPFPPTMNETLTAALIEPNECEWLSDQATEAVVKLLSPAHAKRIAELKKRKEKSVGTVFRRMRKEDGEKVQRAEIRFDGFAGCIRTPKGGSSQQRIVVIEQGQLKIRSLLSREAANLMGLPASYKLPKARTAALSVIGDGLAVPVVSFLRDHLLEALVGSEEQAG